MAVAFDASFESHTGTSGNTGSPNPFTWTHTPVGTPRGILVFVLAGTGSDLVTSVSYGGTAMTNITAAVAVDSVGEPGRTDTWFLGSSIPTGAQTVSVTRSGTNTLYAVSISVTAAADTEIYQPGIVLLQENQTPVEQSVTDGSPGTNSLRFAAICWGGSNPAPAGANSTTLQGLDIGVRTFDVVRETTAGQGARLVGFNTGATDDCAAVHLAVREVSTGQNVAVSGLASEAALGAITPVPGGVSKAVSGLASEAALGSPTALPGGVVVAPAGLASEALLGAVTATNMTNVPVSGLASEASFGSISAIPGGVSVALSGLASEASFFTPTIGGNIVIAVSGLASESLLGVATMFPGGIGEFVGGLASEAAFATPTVSTSGGGGGGGTDPNWDEFPHVM